MKHVARTGANRSAYRVLVGTDQRCEQTQCRHLIVNSSQKKDKKQEL